ncbi:hypothetical protein GS425_12750 [Rhodococcus hoagii]|nr:hypothetical protein [Prescottella equi]
MSPADAARAVESGYLSARGELNTQRGVGSVRAEMKVAAAERTRREEADGAGVTRVSMIVSISADSEAEVKSQSDIINSLASSCRLKVRIAWRHQAAAFLSGLGVGGAAGPRLHRQDPAGVVASPSERTFTMNAFVSFDRLMLRRRVADLVGSTSLAALSTRVRYGTRWQRHANVDVQRRGSGRRREG